MDTKSPSTPTTDGEHWSDETEGSPEHTGYAALDQYQPLGEEGDEEEDDEDNEGTEEQRTESVGGEGWPAGVVDVDTSLQPDMASVLLRAMEEDYRACVESEGHVVSNGPIAAATAATETRKPPSEEPAQQLEGNGTLTPGQGQGLALGIRGGGEADAEVEAPPPAPAPATMRPVSPLGQDRAERVIRAMQGFTLAAPSLPPAPFEADWGHPSALANLAAANTTSAEAGEEGGGAIEPATAPANEDHR
ncbi:expressed unknown protein [Ectocarpus siliculosus]|uniref:Uncharacterized protein n=1 Tax=Ectocarpus siliculosus TaxID=2880 RepID=D7FZ62_ECTSI|nr:expressed unknown protein [Ectocarpus siliculosus]|eukprot:CBJ32679.1 expressed unknown protein [Ectocarpus siliculosus]